MWTIVYCARQGNGEEYEDSEAAHYVIRSEHPLVLFLIKHGLTSVMIPDCDAAHAIDDAWLNETWSEAQKRAYCHLTKCLHWETHPDCFKKITRLCGKTVTFDEQHLCIESMPTDAHDWFDKANMDLYEFIDTVRDAEVLNAIMAL